MKFQLFRCNTKTGEITKAHSSWRPMTEKEAKQTLAAYNGVYSPFATHFIDKFDLLD